MSCAAIRKQARSVCLQSAAAAEVCNGLDDDCDTQIDEGAGTTFYRDADGDGQGTATTTVLACSAPAGYVARGDDCDDTSATSYVGATELCDRRDNNCSSGGAVVEAEDRDRDMHAEPTAACVGGFPKDGCDDTRSNVNPGAPFYEEMPVACGHGSNFSDSYSWCPARRCCVANVEECSGSATCASVSAANWDYDCSGGGVPEPWVTGSCARHPHILGRCVGDGPVGTGTPPACGAPVTHRVCTPTGQTGPCTASTTTSPLASR